MSDDIVEKQAVLFYPVCLSRLIDASKCYLKKTFLCDFFVIIQNNLSVWVFSQEGH